MTERQLLHQIALTFVPEVGDLTAKKLIAYCGSVEAVFSESVQNLRKIPGLSNKVIDSLKASNTMQEAEKELEYIHKNNIQTFFYLDDNYPKRLKHIADSPMLLYFKGNTNLNASKVLAIVGTRSPSDYGQQICEEIVADFAGTDTLIVSGLAYGIDVHAHKAALKYGLKTIGVLGHGLDRIYPSLNQKTAELMLEQGGLLSEFRKGTIPDRQNFPMRNRIVAGMSDATLVIESMAKGGSLITARLAFDYNRDVFAIPGKPKDELSIGCNNLIKNNIAQLVNNANDIKRALNWDEAKRKIAPQKQLFIELDETEEKVVNVLTGESEVSIDIISLESGLSMSKTAAVLLGLEFKGVVRTLPGKQYKRV